MTSQVSKTADLVGRARECALLDDLVSAVRRGESRALVLRGERGIGKTALLEYLARSAPGVTVVRTMGVESEMELAFASLHQVCGPLLDRLPKLPAPQRHALEIVFGLSDGAAPDPLLVGLAVLSLVSAAAGARGLLCVIDDAQWLDHASAVTLAFVARRLSADPVGIVFAAREPGQVLQRIPELEVRGLVKGDARALLGSVLRLKLDEPVRDRIIAETRGNPLALLELPQGLAATQLAGGFGLVGAEGLAAPIEDSFVRRLMVLSDDARRLLLLAAADPVGDPVVVLSAGEHLGITVSVVSGETEELLAVDTRVTFRHPLVRSAVYRAAAATERRAAHLALAKATDPVADPDRRAWHLAAAAEEPNEVVALELERSAGRAQARGGLAATAAFLERAVALTGNPARRGARSLAAAEASLQAGLFDTALGLVATAEAGPLDDFGHARIELLRGRVALASGNPAEGSQLLLQAAGQLERFDPELARDTYLTAWGAAFVAARHVAGGGVLSEICRAVQSLPPPAGAPRPSDLVLDGLTLLTTEGHGAAAATLKRAAKLLTGIPLEDVLLWGWVATSASIATWDEQGFLAISERQVQLVRDAGAVAQLPVHLTQLGIARTWIGDFAGATSIIAEAETVAAAIGTQVPPYASVALRALQGREAEAAPAIAGAFEQADAGARAIASHAHLAAAVLNNGLARYDMAATAARQAAQNTFAPWHSMWALPELVEAASRAGDVGLAGAALERLAEMTQPSDTDFSRGIEARCRALLSDCDTADALYREAIERLDRTPLRPELARAYLLYGEWLRRQNRRVDAREQLRLAYDQFTSIGMEAFAERARMERLATGEKVRKRTVETRDELTDQERQIALLAEDGLSNAEIGARLFLSPRTVEWHLRKVFTKLGIRSRRELTRARRSSSSELLPT